MTSKAVTQKLAALGFAYDETVTLRTHYWSGTIDPIGRFSIDGECRGVAVSGNTRAEMDAEALSEAAAMARHLRPCTDPDCEMHAGTCDG